MASRDKVATLELMCSGLKDVPGHVVDELNRVRHQLLLGPAQHQRRVMVWEGDIKSGYVLAYQGGGAMGQCLLGFGRQNLESRSDAYVVPPPCVRQTELHLLRVGELSVLRA